MSLVLLQRGLTSDLVVLFFPSPIGTLRSTILRSTGPTPIVVIDETATGSDSLLDITRFASVRTGREGVSLVCLGGFSAGCRRVRTLRIAGADASVFLLVDGAHASNPPADWQLKYLQDLATRARQQQISLILSHTYIATEPQFLSTAAVARLATGWELPKPEDGGFNVRFEGNLTVYSVDSGPNDPVAHSAQANLWLPILLDGHLRPILQPGYEPGTIPMARSRVPRRMLTVDGWMDLETEYVPRVTTAEIGAAPVEALKAQAVAARTFVLRAMHDNPLLGTPAEPIPNSESFQTYATAATQACMAATKATAWQVATYQNELIFANYVAGAAWSDSGALVPGTDPKGTQRWVTYNGGRFGDSIQRTKLAADVKANRGCMSQNGARWLAQRRTTCLEILCSFYGADVELYDLRMAAPWSVDVPKPSPPAPEPIRRGDDGGALLLLAGVGAAWWLWKRG